jgi:undecaprenyl-diphosphatase
MQMNALFIFLAKFLIALPIVILCFYFLRQTWLEKKRIVLFAIPALILTYLIARLGGYLYFDPRPFVAGNFTPLIPHAPDNGFPSDHTLLVSAAAAIGMYLDRRLGVVLWALAVIVGVARVYVGLHHPIDVLGSMAISLVVVSLTYFLIKNATHS